MLKLMKKGSEGEPKKDKKPNEVGASGLPIGKPLVINSGKSTIPSKPSSDDVIEEAELNVDPNSTHRIIEKKHRDGKYSKTFVDRKTGATYGENDKYDAPNLNGTLDATKYKRTVLPKDWMNEYRNKQSTVIVSNSDDGNVDKLKLIAMAKNK